MISHTVLEPLVYYAQGVIDGQQYFILYLQGNY
jgi:hypothetical protein